MRIYECQGHFKEMFVCRTIALWTKDGRSVGKIFFLLIFLKKTLFTNMNFKGNQQ